MKKAYLETYENYIILHFVGEIKEIWFQDVAQATEYIRKNNIEVIYNALV